MSPSPSPTSLIPAPGWHWPRRGALWLHASIVLGFLAASSAPSPLYALYRQAWGFSALTLTLVFASYAFALLAALLVLGHWSDHHGRRPVLLRALLLEIGATVLFWRADSVAWLLAARLLQGLATGIATSTLSAALLDLDRERGALFNSVAPMLGMALGALGSSALVQFAPAPTTLVFECLLLMFGLQTVAALFVPETVQRRPLPWRSLWPRIAIPPAARPSLLGILPVNTAQWALGGFYLSLGPTLARLVSGRDSPLIGGALIACLVLSGALAILLLRARPARQVLLGGTLALGLGLAISLLGVWRLSSTLLFAGTLVAGIGFGAGFNASVRSLVVLAPPAERGALMAGFFALSYLAFSLPALAAGLAVGWLGLGATALGFGLCLLALCALALWLMRRGAHAPTRAAK